MALPREIGKAGQVVVVDSSSPDGVKWFNLHPPERQHVPSADCWCNPEVEDFSDDD